MPSEHQCAPGDENKVMHVAMPIGERGDVLMGSDNGSGMADVVIGQNFSISVSTGTEEETRKLFDGLSDGAEAITMPLQQTFWAPLFGMLRDKFGVNWMVSYDKQS